MNERRAVERYEVRIAGKLISPDMSDCVDVVIRDLSEDGALVTSTVPASLPERIYLWEARKGTIFECGVRWRRLDRFFGLHFTDSAGRARRRALIEAATSAPVEDRPRPRACAPRPRFTPGAGDRAGSANQQRTA